MKANGLAQFYDRLKVWERIRLLFAARERQDESEEDALFKSAPIRTWRLPDHLLSEQVLHVMSMMYVGEQLDAAAHYFFTLWHADGPENPNPDEWIRVAQVDAYYFTANADAWRRFCSDLGISADALTAANHHGWFLRYCEQHMPAHAPSAATVQAWYRQADGKAVHVVTADDLLESWRDVLRALTPNAP